MAAPTQVHHYIYSGGHHRYAADACSTAPAADPATYALPHCPLLPGDTTYDAGAPRDVPAWRSSSGHILVDLQLNGRLAGYAILDTGE